MSERSHRVRVYPTRANLSDAVADQFASVVRESIDQRESCHIVLAGGSTPRGLYERVAKRSDIDWSRVQFFWGDERCVDPSSTESNYRMAREALLDQVPVGNDKIHRIPAEKNPVDAAREYEATVRAALASAPEARFDLVLLGMGDDGHTASLFPNTAALHETTRWVVANSVPQLAATRITMTTTALNTARQAWFLVCGDDKAGKLTEVLEGPRSTDQLPSQLIQPTDGELTWHVDTSAASLLTLALQEPA